MELTENNGKLVKNSLPPSTHIESTNYYEPIKQQQQQQGKLKEKNNLKTNDLNLKSLNQQPKQQQKQQDNEASKFVLNKLNTLSKSPSTLSTSSSSTSSAQSSPAVNNKNKQQKSSNDQQQQKVAKTQPKPINKPSNDLNKNAKKAPNFATHKKFSVGNYVHLLAGDDAAAPVEGEEKEEEDNQDYWEEDKNVERTKKLAASFNNNIDRIAEKINSTARTKWKNSNEPQTNGANRTIPQHIRFESSTSSDDSSSSDSSSESSSSDDSNLKNVKILNKQNVQKLNNIKKSPPQKQQQQKPQQKPQQKQQNNWKPMTKDEQLNMVSYNRSYVIQV